MTFSGDDFDDRSWPRGSRDARVKHRAEWLARREVGHGEEWQHFVDEATGEVNWERLARHLTSEGWQHVETYTYRNHDGRPVFEVLRYQHQLQPRLKKFIPRYRNLDNRLIVKESPVRVPYNLPDLLARPDEPITLCEGEKAANRAMAAGILATCVHGQRWSNIVTGYFVDRDVLVVPDQDDAGEKNARKALEHLVKAGSRPRLVRLDGLKRTDDLFDWLEAGHTKEQLLAIAERQPVHGPIAPTAIKWHGDAAVIENPWLVSGLVPETGVGLIVGQWGTGKTFLALDLSASIIVTTEERFIDYPIRRHGGVLFIAAEGAASIRLRLTAALADKLGRSIMDDVPRQPFAWVDCQPDLLKNGAAELIPIVEASAAKMRDQFERDLVLIVVDTVAAAAAFEDENDAAQAQRVMGALGELSRRTGAFVIGVDHLGKDQTAGARGSSAKEAYAENILTLLGDRELTGRVTNLRMGVRKVKDGEIGRVMPLRLQVVDCGGDADGNQVTTCVIRWELGRTETARPGRPASRRDAFREALTQALATASETIKVNGADVQAVRKQILGEKFSALYSGRADPGEALSKAIRSARVLGEIYEYRHAGTDYIWRPEAVF